ncbi:class I SAM-dependent methyltransferase [Rhizobium sp. P38BS-XIX]|uniref:class I SAM-dependent methyltransferase n=1 Tax=Rhizobium sp. P38BS-XIX TaxID=2726740 RepID=UPI001456D66A|nr:class I SAM-dependent methyltransferase [Rhizobium sp. P38BS-XIX]NLR95850.1 class I SAM-dependent methyltransferase [Rhizobium sp. P38BS-XIX]
MQLVAGVGEVDVLDGALRRSWNEVQGWVGDRIPHILKFVRELHDAQKVEGDILEIGVHHGKLFFMLSAISRDHDRCVAVDLFEDQDKNLDHSGKGSLAIFTRHLHELFPDYASRVTAISADSMSLTPVTVRGRLGVDGVRLISVDGGHTIAHVVNDMALAQELLVPGGIILLDDFLGVHWPTVTEGFYKYMQIANRRLAPFLIFQNKLFLTTFSEQPETLARFREFLDRTLPNEIHSGRWRYTTVGDNSVLSFA